MSVIWVCFLPILESMKPMIMKNIYMLAHGEPKEEKEKWLDLLASDKTRCIYS